MGSGGQTATAAVPAPNSVARLVAAAVVAGKPEAVTPSAPDPADGEEQEKAEYPPGTDLHFAELSRIEAWSGG